MRPINPPKRPVGNDDLSIFLQKTFDRLFKKLVFNNSSTVQVREAENGISFDASPGGGSGTTVQLCVVTELFGDDSGVAFDYFGATPWNAQSNNISGSQIIVAKSVSARGPVSELIDGDLIQYSQYMYDESRFAFNEQTEAAEWDVCNERYITIPVDGGGNPMPPPVDDNGNPLPYAIAPYIGLTIKQCFVWVTRTSNPTGVTDDTGNQIYLLEVAPFRRWVYSINLNGGYPS